jgi:hypothetical protein
MQDAQVFRASGGRVDVLELVMDAVVIPKGPDASAEIMRFFLQQPAPIAGAA